MYNQNDSSIYNHSSILIVLKIKKNADTKIKTILNNIKFQIKSNY